MTVKHMISAQYALNDAIGDAKKAARNWARAYVHVQGEAASQSMISNLRGRLLHARINAEEFMKLQALQDVMIRADLKSDVDDEAEAA